MIASLQMAGLFVGCLVSGHIADAVGRKLPLFTSVILMLIFNIVAYFSVSWVMFAVARVGLGTVQYHIFGLFVFSTSYLTSGW